MARRTGAPAGQLRRVPPGDVADREGGLRERIPVAKIANIVEGVPRHREIQLCLVHRQTALNFSMDLFRRGVFGRLVEELGRRGHQMQILAASPSPRLKEHPLALVTPAMLGQNLYARWQDEFDG